MSERIIIIGAGGHGKVVLDICHALDLEPLGFVDTALAKGVTVLGCPVLGGDEVLDDAELCRDSRFTIAITAPAIKQRLTDEVQKRNLPLTTLVHPAAHISSTAALGPGVQVMCGAIVNAAATIGAHSIVNTAAIVEHDAILNEYVHVAPGAVLSGGVTCGANVMIGANATVLPNLTIGDGATVAAGAVVTKDVAAGSTVCGAPARPMGSAT